MNLQKQLALHRENWRNCTRCDLCKDRKQVVISKGVVPCKVLFVGEAPGESEDDLGVPFKGEAGHQFHDMLDEVLQEVQFSYAVTNILGCIPYAPPDSPDTVRKPTKNEIKACQLRVIEFIRMCSPKLIVCLGEVAARSIPPENLCERTFRKLCLLHPSAILRQSSLAAETSYRRFVITLTKAVKNL